MKTLIHDFLKINFKRSYTCILSFYKKYFVKEPDPKRDVLQNAIYQLHADDNVTVKTVFEIRGWVGIYQVN